MSLTGEHPSQADMPAKSAQLASSAGSAFVDVKHDGETEEASPLVWWLARLGLRAMGRQPRPQVGDTVVEVTHLMGLARHRLGLLSAVGELVKVETDDHQMPVYTIRNLNGKETRWSNAEIVTVEERPNVQDQPRAEKED